MTRRFLPFLFVIGWGIFLIGVAPARAAEPADFEAAVDGAYRSYRTALFYAHTGNTDLAAIELRQAQDTWSDIQGKYLATPPAAYAKDPHWGDDLEAVAQKLADTVALLDAGKGKEAEAAGRSIADTLSNLRKRNGRAGYSDCVLDLTRQMDVLFRWRHQPPVLTDQAQANKIMAQALGYRAQLLRCRALAPKEYAGTPDFARIYDGANKSVSSLPPAIERKDPHAVVNILRELISFDRILFFKLG